MKKSYYIFNSGKISRKDNTLRFISKNEETKYLPVENIDDIYIFGQADTNNALFNFLGNSDISVHFFDYYENYTGSFVPKSSLLSGKLLISQVEFYTNLEKRLNIAKKFVDGSSFNMLKNLKYYNNRNKDLSDMMEKIINIREKINVSISIEELMGYEGNMKNLYYDCFNLILKNFQFNKRVKNPPNDEINALISFGNSLCYSQCLRSIHQTQLNPLISYLHSSGDRRYSLSLDISEIFKPILVDRTIFKLINKKEIDYKHFDTNFNNCLLKENGRKIFVKTFQEKLNETIKHRSLGKNVSYKYLIRLECYKLIKHLLNIEEYKPFKIYW